MTKSAVIMGMPVRITIVDEGNINEAIAHVFSYFRHIDKTFSTYKNSSVISKINNGLLSQKNVSKEVAQVLARCEQTKRETGGFFNAWKNGKLDPSGLVKGYAIYHGAQMLHKFGFKNFAVEIAGDVQVFGTNEEKKPWRIGIQNPFKVNENVKIVAVIDKGIATSGTYVQGRHIYDPVHKIAADEIASMTVIADNVYDADRFATAAFAMGEKGIAFIQKLSGYEGYMIKKDKKAVYTDGFEKFVV
ncbi:MAG TPA: FAD:protein FMN transferase [Candidatus Saccharimonadales bacterium]|nr:FAD:protein FMN transferase [Candidatus Saccharimonadales bacterium]